MEKEFNTCAEDTGFTLVRFAALLDSRYVLEVHLASGHWTSLSRYCTETRTVCVVLRNVIISNGRRGIGPEYAFKSRFQADQKGVVSRCTIHLSYLTYN